MHTIQSVDVLQSSDEDPKHWVHIPDGVTLETCTVLGVSPVRNEGKICGRKPQLAF